MPIAAFGDKMIERHGLSVDDRLDDFISRKALPDTGIKAEDFWRGFADLIQDLAPKNRALLEKRDALQARIDAWWKAHPDAGIAAQKDFLTEIGYLLPEGPDFSIETAGIDPEIATIAGPQLVVPVTNARYALNAANARWGSLYDCFYGTDVMGLPLPAGGYDRGRGARVVARTRVFLDEAFPIEGTSHADVRRYSVKDGALLVDDLPLLQPEKFVGYRGNPKAPDSVLLQNNGLHVELIFDRAHPIGSRDQALLADVVIESAVSAIIDCEDSVACVDAEDRCSPTRIGWG
jgi:malate synthase